MVTFTESTQPEVYQGQFGEYRITDRDRQGVIIYRSGLAVAALSFAIATLLLFWQGTTPFVLNTVTLLFSLFTLSLGVSLLTIHIYLRPLHRLLQLFWLTGTIASAIIILRSSQPLALFVYNHPITLFGVGFTFAALTGIYFKEAFCFDRLETKFLTPLVPALLLGHIAGVFSLAVEQFLLTAWAFLFIIFAVRKLIQPINPDIGDKSVFEYLEKQRHSATPLGE